MSIPNAICFFPNKQIVYFPNGLPVGKDYAGENADGQPFRGGRYPVQSTYTGCGNIRIS
ncbi:hypothetical protein CE91St3_32230 [Parabacteroides merdae]|uniref:Uncharacterized protein n=1 Tax=Parabacteroides merdae TaxID=46503 RepID=A0AA37KDL2_9BACT|nr:hypothetical protein CE91St3_32230 [Parabacteroides merdae]